MIDSATDLPRKFGHRVHDSRSGGWYTAELNGWVKELPGNTTRPPMAVFIPAPPDWEVGRAPHDAK